MNAFIHIHRNVMSGQCKGALLRLQVRHTAVFLFPKLWPKRFGFQLGLFTPYKTVNGYRCFGFYFFFGGFRDIAVSSLPRWQQFVIRRIGFSFE